MIKYIWYKLTADINLRELAVLLLCVLFLTFCFMFVFGCTPGARHTLHWDNDIFKPTKNNDRDFSNGVRLTRETPDETGFTNIFIGQNFYTPGKKYLTEAQPNDRPYAGYLYAGTDYKYARSESIMDVFGVTAGIVGPHSYAEQTQNEVHRFLNQRTAKGWDNQLENEVGIIFKAERQYWHPCNSSLDFVHTIGGHLGNVFTQAYGNAYVRFGRNLHSIFGDPGIIYPRVPRTNVGIDWSYYLYAGPAARAVAHNIFLDGNTFKDSQSVDKYPFVAEGRLGFAIERGLYRFAYTYVITQREYKNEEANPDFGEITLSVGWQ